MDSDTATNRVWPPPMQDPAAAVPQAEPPPAGETAPTPSLVGWRALQVAIGKLGQAEVGGQNKGPIVDWSIRLWTAAHAGEWARWCAGFVSTCFAEAGALPGSWSKIGSLSADTLWHRCVHSGWARRSAIGAGPGDIAFFTYGGDPDGSKLGLRHVGIVESLDGRALRTVEGNAGDAVRRRTYDLSNPQIYGFARVPG